MSIEILKGKTLTDINVNDEQDVVRFTTSDGEVYRMHHHQNCCENVSLNETIGDLKDLIGSPILEAEEASEEAKTENSWSTGTWTFYKLGTAKGHVTLRWLGESNGYYSESVDFELEK